MFTVCRDAGPSCGHPPGRTADWASYGPTNPYSTTRCDRCPIPKGSGRSTPSPTPRRPTKLPTTTATYRGQRVGAGDSVIRSSGTYGDALKRKTTPRNAAPFPHRLYLRGMRVPREHPCRWPGSASKRVRRGFGSAGKEAPHSESGFTAASRRLVRYPHATTARALTTGSQLKGRVTRRSRSWMIISPAVHPRMAAPAAMIIG